METRSEEELFEHGIQTENSDIRAHVGVFARRVFVFQTKPTLARLEMMKAELEEADAFQEGVNGRTASGLKVPLSCIPDLRVIDCSKKPWGGWDGWVETLSTSEKGRRAVDLVCLVLKHGRFPLWIDLAHDDDRPSVQIKGTDIVVFAMKKIQVKCDYRAGTKQMHPCCTGNLFIQYRERNPLKRI